MENKVETKKSADDEDDSNCIFRPGKDLELISVKYIMKLNGNSLEELKPKDWSTENAQAVLKESAIIANSNIGFRTPIFKSPVTSNVVNLKLKLATQAKKHVKQESADFSIIEGTEDIENVFFDDNCSINKYKRKSSLVAESKIKKLVEEDKKGFWKEDLFVKSSFESMFCGISKTKKNPFKAGEDSFISNILKGSCLEGNGIKALQDKTNSPRKFDGVVKKHDVEVKPPLNTKFFVEECLIEENQVLELDKKTNIDENIAPSLSKGYLKLKDINTKYNEGYKTVEIKKKVVIDLVGCPKMFFRKSTRSRMVYFDTEVKHNTHNINGIIKPIITQSSSEAANFEWEGNKEVIEVVQRIDLGSDISTEEFVFKRLGNQIES